MEEEKKQIKIKLSTAIIIFFVIILLACIGIYFGFFYNRVEEESQNEIQEPIVEEVSPYYEPTEQELSRAKELENILRNNLPEMDGSTSTIPLEGGIIASLFDLTQEEAEAGVAHSTTYGSFNNLMEDKCDIIFSTPLSEEQLNTAKSKNIELELVPVVYEGFVFVVNASNPVDTLTQQQIKDIYSGKITNWKEVGGNDAEIVAYQRNETSGSQNYMTAFMKDSQLMEPKTDFIPASMVGLMDAVATYDNAENAIGYSVYAYAADMYGNGNEIKFIKVDGVEPTKATMASKEYPLLNYNYAIYNKAKEDSTTVDDLCEWLLNYNGQVAMSKAGYIPIINIKAEEEKIVPYTKKGTGGIKPTDYSLDSVKYTIYSENILDNNRVKGLNNQELQNSINQFIEDSIVKLDSKKQEFNNYLKLLNERTNEINGQSLDDYDLYQNEGITTELECINGYLSVKVYLKYSFAVQTGTPYIYDGYSAIFDLYTGEKLELSDLYFKDTEFITDINESIKYSENHIPELEPERKIKRTFVSVPADIKMYSLETIGFVKFNPYFSEGEVFELDNYANKNNKIIYKARNMEGIWDSSIEINKEPNIIMFAGEMLEEKRENIKYSIYTIDIGDVEIDSKVNSYIKNYLQTQATPEIINRKVQEEFNYLSDSSEILVEAYGITYGNQVAQVDITIGMEPFGNLFFNLTTGELLDITYDEWIEQNQL